MDRHPPSDNAFAHIRETLGDEAADTIINALGGTEWRIPSVAALSDDHMLVRHLGWPLAEAVCTEMVGEQIIIPLGGRKASYSRKELVEAIERGLSRNEMAMHFGISTRQLRRRLGKCGLSGQNNRTHHRRGRKTNTPQAIAIRDRIICDLIDGRISDTLASVKLGLPIVTIRDLARRYRKFRTTDPAAEARARADASPAASNGGLTGGDASGTAPTPQKAKRQPVAA